MQHHATTIPYGFLLAFVGPASAWERTGEIHISERTGEIHISGVRGPWERTGEIHISGVRGPSSCLGKDGGDTHKNTCDGTYALHVCVICRERI